MFESPKNRIDSFKDQWENPEKITLSGEELDVYDIKPESQKSEVPTVMIPGWGGTPEMYKDNIKTLADEGRRTLSVNAPHGIDYNKEEFDLSEVDQMPDAELRRISALMNTIDEKDIEKIDAVGHSEGCLDIVLAATLYPERFRNVVLVNPAGMIGKDNFWRLATGFSSDVVKGYTEKIRKGEVTKRMLRGIRDVTGSVVKNPILALREVFAISDAQIHDMLVGLREKGIGISIVSAEDDEAFSSERMKEIVTLEMIDQFISVPGKHGSFQLEPETYTKIAESALTAMEEASKERTGQTI